MGLTAVAKRRGTDVVKRTEARCSWLSARSILIRELLLVALGAGALLVDIIVIAPDQPAVPSGGTPTGQSGIERGA